MSNTTFTVKDLTELATACFQAVGVPQEDAAWTAEVLVRADLQGTSTHGLSRLAAYVSGIRKGKIKARPNLHVQHTGPVSALVDGDQGLGPVIAKAAMNAAMEQAKLAGVGVVTVQNGNHAGAMSTYTEMAAEVGMIGLALSNAQPAIPPWGGRQAYFGTNPIALAAPRHGDSPISIDLATSVTARGNIIMAAKQGVAIPEGWAIDEAGFPTTDAEKALKGAVLPIAGPKGYSLALLVEILAGVLSGGNFGNHVGSIYDSGNAPPGTGMFMLVLNPDFFVGRDEFAIRASQMSTEVSLLPRAAGHGPIRLPGERRQELETSRRATGVPLSLETVAELRQIAVEYGVIMPNPVILKELTH